MANKAAGQLSQQENWKSEVNMCQSGSKFGQGKLHKRNAIVRGRKGVAACPGLAYVSP